MADAKDLYPLLCKPLLKTRIWGGRKLESLFGFDLPSSAKIGEAWMAADLPEGASWVANGPHAGKTLSEVTALWGERMIGSAWRGKRTGGRFPLLVKFLDAHDDLSVQVHPDERACRESFPDDFPKDESWIIVDAEPGGRILHGFVPGTAPADFDRLVAQGRVTDCIRSVAVAPGDVFRIAPGTVHALCRGVALLEIQEPSDSTFRIYDYGRLGDDGRPRALHIDAARKAARFPDCDPRFPGSDLPARIEPLATERPWGRQEVLVDVDAYRIERLRVAQPLEWRIDPRSAQVLVVLTGRGVLSDGGRIEGPGVAQAFQPASSRQAEKLEPRKPNEPREPHEPRELREPHDPLLLAKGDCVILPAALGKARLTLSDDEPMQCILACAGGIDPIDA